MCHRNPTQLLALALRVTVHLPVGFNALLIDGGSGGVLVIACGTLSYTSYVWNNESQGHAHTGVADESSPNTGKVSAEPF